MRFRAKSLTSLLFAFLLALPMISVISKVIYVQSNKNAYESYYGDTINEEKPIPLQSKGDFKFDELYYFSGQNQINTLDTVILEANNRIYAKNTIVNDTNYGDTRIGFYAEVNTNLYFYIRELNANTLLYSGPFSTTTLSFVYQNSNFQNSVINLFINDFYFIEYNKYSYLDNVFEYAVDEVIKENNFGNIDFFSYFTSIFMSDNQVNNRYIGYVNYYLNYALMVSLAYLLFLMLMWFINFARRFLDRGMNYDW